MCFLCVGVGDLDNLGLRLLLRIWVSLPPIIVDGASADGTMWVWNIQTGEQGDSLEGRQDEVYGVCSVTNDGRELLASASIGRPKAVILGRFVSCFPGR